jgi:hypothetical protein
MRLFVGCAVAAIAACGGRYRTELVGSAGATVALRGAPVGAGGGTGIQLPAGTYEVAMRFEIPRAQVIEWRLACPGAEAAGTAGETLEQYRARRLAQLREERERERQRVASVAGALAGLAPLPRASGGARVEAPGAHATVSGEVAVSPDAVGAAVGAAVVDLEVQLPPGDVGRGTLAANARLQTAGDGACALHAIADDPDVRGTFEVVRVRDLDAEARLRRMAVADGAAQVRTRVTAHLVALGADPAARAARLEAEAAARRARAEAAAQAEARVRAEAEAKLRVRVSYEERRRAMAYEARGWVVAYLVGKCQADPHRRERVAERERRERERRLVADAERAARLEADALQARAHLRAYLIALGAKERPPKPPPRPEEPGEPPFPGAEWTAGEWRWEDAAWAWIDGAWSEPTVFGDAGGDVGVDAGVGVGVGVGVGIGVNVGGDRVRDHRDLSDRTRGPAVRDHRDRTRAPVVRDHRGDQRHDRPLVIRDHRGGKRDDRPPVVRDHRDGHRNDPPPVVRDHRESRSEPRDSRSSKSKDDDDDDRRARTPRDRRR